MAVHPEHPGLCAEVVINEESLKEYDDEEAIEEPPSENITKYAQVDTDTNFGVRYTIPMGLTGECGVRSQLLLDGKRICSRVHRRQEIEGGDITNCLDKLHTTINGANYQQRFRFSQLRIEEEAKRDEHTPQQLQPIGTVTLKLNFINSLTKRDRTPEPQQTPAPEAAHQEKLPSLGSIAEKSMKGDAKSHQTSLDAPIFAGRYTPSRSKTRTVYNCGKTFAIFNFKYRSLAALRSLHIVEPTPSSSPPPTTHRAVEDLTREEVEAIARNSQVKAEPEVAVKRERRSAFKREAGAVGSDDEVEFVSSKRRKTVPSQQDEVIVLD
ncbi:hypothetical protein DE146DRAFT_738909 [Phaeosphaeria sp. MPI-PUGE-AT-0046c]|nr:hypothetical protein DE146DRAFT_738909 [Phaeosphaeria sp. MPI-PUGE-AT-0046c]